MLVEAPTLRPTGPAATEASPPRLNWPLAIRSTLRWVLNTRMMSVDDTPAWKPTDPPVRVMKAGSDQSPLPVRTASTPLPRCTPPKKLILNTLGMTAMP